MTKAKECPTCGIPWEHEETITEYFFRAYTENGIPDYILTKGIKDIKMAAASSASAFGCRPETPHHFGDNVVGVETDDYDGVSWWCCTVCGIAHHATNPNRTSTEFKDQFKK